MMSNKNLALLLVVTIVVSLGGTLISLNKLNQFGATGMFAGVVNLSISNNTGCNIDHNVSFGAGYPNQTIILSTASDSITGFENCSTDTNADCYYGMQINNTGNTLLYVNFTSDKNATGLLDPNAALSNFKFYVVNGTKAAASQGCFGDGLINGYGPVNNTEDIRVCDNLSYVDGADIVTIGWNATVNQSTPKTGEKKASITINCGQV